MLDLAQLHRTADFVHGFVQPTPQLEWPLLSRELGCQVFVKHENHLPTGAFKVRGGLVLLHALREQGVKDVIAATRGNHGQSIAFAARVFGMKATLVVPKGNSVSKNAAMRGFGAELIEHGRDFQDAYDWMQEMAKESGVHPVPSFDPLLVEGVATYGLELFEAGGNLDAVYVPIGWGSGMCGLISARAALGCRTALIGAVAEQANSFAQSFAAGRVIETAVPETIADGIAVRRPHPEGLSWVRSGAERIVEVSEIAILRAMRLYFDTIHNVAEGAAAAALAAAIKDDAGRRFKRIALVLSGSNVDSSLYKTVF
ncbi:MAG TPA: threonine dehydratase [Terriglobia bacterium]|nr:threonine dehydratase [Terriglobia bacterium]